MNLEKWMHHTDLALELQEDLEEVSNLDGIKIMKNNIGKEKLRETVITVENEKGEKMLGKPKGIYITLEGDDLSKNDGGFHENMSRRLAFYVEKLIGEKQNILFVGLGNGEVTPDALGPLVIRNLLITRHLSSFEYFEKMRSSMAIAPGVMAQTGMETGEIIKGMIENSHPDILVVIDALAAKSFERLNTTIQISDTGIAPGSGVGNKRNEISLATMGIPVIAVGVPTVISIPAMAGDIMSSFMKSVGDTKLAEKYENWSISDKYRFMAKVLNEKLFDLFVTPKEIDEAVKRISFTISEGLNKVIAKKV